MALAGRRSLAELSPDLVGVSPYEAGTDGSIGRPPRQSDLGHADDLAEMVHRIRRESGEMVVEEHEGHAHLVPDLLQTLSPEPELVAPVGPDLPVPLLGDRGVVADEP